MNWFALGMQLLPVIEQAIDTICKAEGVTPEQAVNRLVEHLTPGQPNVPALSGGSTHA